MVSKYTTTWSQIQEQMNEFTLVHVARWKGKDGKRYASPFKTKDSAEKKAKELRSQGNSEVSVTQDTLRGNIKWAKDGGPDIKGMQKEESDHEVSMARGELEAIADKATQLAGALQGKSDEGNPLEAWVQSKITKAKDYINSVSDYLMYNPDIKMNEEKKDLKATKEFEKDLAAEADLTKGQIKKVHKMADELPKKDFKDRYGKEKGDSVRYATATNIVKKKEGIKEMQQIDEKIEGLKNKSEKSGIPYGILKQVYNRGMAAWKGGHRPGTTPQQWAFARVNAFITKGKAYYTADADLAKKARAAKKGK